jgi:hypothetical protein
LNENGSAAFQVCSVMVAAGGGGGGFAGAALVEAAGVSATAVISKILATREASMIGYFF